MKMYEILIDFNNVSKEKKNSQFSLDGNTYTASVSVSPWSKDVLFSLYLDREPVILNKIAVVGERLLFSFGRTGFTNKLNCDLAFLPTDPSFKVGNKVDWKDLGSKVKLMYVSYGDE